MLFNGWQGLLHTLVVGFLAYAGLVAMLRVSGKRTLAKWNAFDLVVTVAFGSTLATALLSRDTSLAQALVAFLLLVLLQFTVTWLSVRSRGFQSLIKSRPTLLLYRGRYREDEMRRERVTPTELRAALRAQGIAAVEDVFAVILETEGEFSVIKETGDRPPSALEGIEGLDEIGEIEVDGARGG